jgi:transcriptional regulator with GAF, ATPase, and Fis domain
MCIRDLRSSLWDNIFTRDVGLYNRYLWNRMEDFSTMLLGETGTGKGLAAAAIGRSGYIPFNDKLGTFSESFAQAFVSINLSEYQEQLIESELFGHKKGAFTGAIESHDGIFSRCSPCGAIFLDEIGDVAIPVQIKLLQVLQERFFTPVGSHKQERFQGRVIAATNRDIDLLRDRGTFRNDFYYRLCSDLIEVPPLRRRLAEDPGEIDEILGFIVNRILGQPSAEIVEKVKEVLRVSQPKDYAWPGNVRELEQCVRRILLKNSYEWHRQEAADNAAARLARGLDNGRMTAQEMLSDYCRILYDRLGTYEAVARTTRLDRRTVKKYIES